MIRVENCPEETPPVREDVMLKTRPLSDTLGVEIQGVDLTQELDEPTARAIIAALHEHQVILFRNQDLPPEQFERFALNLGTPIPHVLDHLHLPGLPGVMELSNKAKSERSLNGAGFWHTDQSYEAEPSSCTMLHALQVPEVGGGTCIADMFAAYDDLPKSTKNRIEGLAANHLYGNRDAGKEGEPEASPLKNAEQMARVPMVRHPLVRPHPVTGRKALYGVTGSSREVVGLPLTKAWPCWTNSRRMPPRRSTFIRISTRWTTYSCGIPRLPCTRPCGRPGAPMRTIHAACTASASSSKSEN